jgi:glucose-1-phosphate adenylyltransferase
MLEAGKRMMAYPFEGYWKDVGTIESLWEANMDLLDENNELNIYDKNWKIYSVSPTLPAQYVGNHAVIKNSVISDGCEIFGEVINSVLFPGVHVAKGCKIVDSVIMSSTKVKTKASITKAIIGGDVIIEETSKVGDGSKIAVVGEGQVIDKDTMI